MTGRWVCPIVKNRFWMLTENDQTLRSSVRSLHSSMSGHHLTIEIERSVFEEKGHVASIERSDAWFLCPVDMTGASDHPVLCPVKGYNSSIHGGFLFKPHGWLKLTLLAICIDIATL